MERQAREAGESGFGVLGRRCKCVLAICIEGKVGLGRSFLIRSDGIEDTEAWREVDVAGDAEDEGMKLRNSD
jgi:hypothetical protein